MNTVLVGAQWGDEGTGKVIDFLDLVGGQLGVLSVGPARETTLRINI